MKTSHPLLRHEAVRFWLALGIAVEVLILALAAAMPLSADGEQERAAATGADLLLQSWPFLALALLYAVTVVGLVWELDERAAVIGIPFYGCVAAVIGGNVAQFIRSWDLLLQAPTSSAAFTLAYSEILAAVVVAPALLIVLAVGLRPLVRDGFDKAASLVQHPPHPRRHGEKPGAGSPPVARA